jgi:aspartyl-tRNA(Asn)/glutamyl-tRNA(Gln) amidotransferase subunit B
VAELARASDGHGGADGAPARIEPAVAQQLANWISGELVRRLGDEDPAASRVGPAQLARLVALVSRRAITAGAGRQVLDRMVKEGGEPGEIVETEGLGAIAGGDEQLAAVVAAAIEAHQGAAEKLRAGNAKAMGPIVGYVMRETKGRADGAEVGRLVREQLGLEQ